MKNKNAVVLLNMGGPDSIDAVEPFLFNLFQDPDIFKIPFGQKLFAKLISKLRASKVAEQYKQIGGKSPLNEHTEEQRYLLEKSLRDANINADVLIAMRYWKPFTLDAIETIIRNTYNQIILLPLYPHFSSVTTGSSFNEWWRHYKGNNVIEINGFFNHPQYINALNKQINESLLQFSKSSNNKTELLFSAHSLPQKLVDKGDPYQTQILESIKLVMELRNSSENFHVSYQSKVGPVKWIQPSTKDKITELGKNGITDLLVIPISFVSDHIETLFELDVEYRKIAEENGIKNFRVMKGLNNSHEFIALLHNLVLKGLNNE